ncbi:alpha/beta hydrolase family protein [Niastella caeni]|nr:prolyl oligopeptidase family serine peptidase [Niastella caeni]
MNRLILFFLLGINSNVLAQNNAILVNKNVQGKADERWNLGRFVWSHTHQLSSQLGKPILDFNAIDNWVSFPVGKNVTISPDGQYIAYGVSTNRLGEVDSIVLQSTISGWRQSLGGSVNGFFSADSKLYFCQDKEELCFMALGNDRPRKVKDVLSYHVPLNGNLSGKNEWIAYQLKNKDVVLQNLLTGIEKRFSGVVDYGFDRTGKCLAYQLSNDKELVVYCLSTGIAYRFSFVIGYRFSVSGSALSLIISNSSTNQSGLLYVDLSDGKAIPIWQASSNNSTISDLQLDDSGKQLVFVVQDSSKKNSIWYWRVGLEKAEMLLKDNSIGIEDGLLIQGMASFTDNNQYIQFSLAPLTKEKKVTDPDAVQVDVWSYMDTILQSTQPYLLDKAVKFTAVLNPENMKVIQLESENEKIITRGISGDVAVVQTISNNDRFWERESGNNKTFVVSLKDGSRKSLTEKVGAPSVQFSPNGEYLVFFNGDKIGNYFSYNLRSGKLVNISGRVPSVQFGVRSEDTNRTYNTVDRMIGWLEDEGCVLVADNYDIWQLDLYGNKPPVNCTNGYGRQHNIIIRVSGEGKMGIYKSKDTLLLKAFNRQSKFNGYYRMVLGVPGKPEKLYMGPCFMENLNGIGGSGSGMYPVKAADANIWIVQRQTATEAPNYYVTKDFKNYHPLTHLQPQKNYNWFTTELHSYKHLDGIMGQGVLYKPENFDSTKKYPVIITFYASLSDQLYQFLPPNYISSPVIFAKPAWMVSHGYLVFVPDIRFIPGNWGLSTMNSIEGAARYLKTLSYVDGEHMGAAGHSNSGRFGYYLFTHSNSFAAMSIGAGTTNIINLSLSLARDNLGSRLEWGELDSYGTGLGNLWLNKISWMDHTSVLSADKVVSPLLQFHSKKDGAPVEQAVQMYIALRRLEKPVWWLQYDEEGHTIGKVKDLRDFTIRYTQFFDHYLKNAPAPRWMTEGIPYKLKGIESRFELDSKSYCRKKCSVCKKNNME